MEKAKTRQEDRGEEVCAARGTRVSLSSRQRKLRIPEQSVTNGASNTSHGVPHMTSLRNRGQGNSRNASMGVGSLVRDKVSGVLDVLRRAASRAAVSEGNEHGFRGWCIR